MRALLVSILLCSAALSLGCASGPTGPTGGTKGTSTGEPNGPVGLCMFNRRQGGVYRCLSFTMGKCNLFGDRCTEEEFEAQQKALGNRAGEEKAAQP